MAIVTIVILNHVYKENNKTWHTPWFAGDLLRIKGAVGELHRLPVRDNGDGEGER